MDFVAGLTVHEVVGAPSTLFDFFVFFKPARTGVFHPFPGRFPGHARTSNVDLLEVRCILIQVGFVNASLARALFNLVVLEVPVAGLPEELFPCWPWKALAPHIPYIFIFVVLWECVVSHAVFALSDLIVLDESPPAQTLDPFPRVHPRHALALYSLVLGKCGVVRDA